MPEQKTVLVPNTTVFHPPTLSEPERPANFELRKIATDVLNSMRFRFAAEFSAPSTSTDPVLEGLRSFMAKRKPAAAAAASRRAKGLLASPVEARDLVFGRFAGLDTAAGRKNYSELSKIAPKLVVDGNRLKAALEEARDNDLVFTNTEGPADLQGFVKLKKRFKIDLSGLAAAVDRAEGAKFKKLGLFIKKVECLEETSGPGSDEIAMGGNKTAPDGETKLVKQFMVSNDFDEGETKTYGGDGKRFCEWNLVAGPDFPYVYGAVMVMAEKDDGGFHDFLVKLWNKVSDEVKGAVTSAVGAGIGLAIGAAFAGIGALIGAAVGWLVGLLVGWVISLFDNEDDIIAAKTYVMWLGAATKSYYEWAGLLGPQKLFSANFNGDGGRYRVWMQYRVYA